MTDATQNFIAIDDMLEYLGYVPNSEDQLNEAREALASYTLSQGQLQNLSVLLNTLCLNFEVTTRVGRNCREVSYTRKVFKNLLKDGDFECIVKGIYDNNITDSQFNTFFSCHMLREVIFEHTKENIPSTEEFHTCIKKTTYFSSKAFTESFNWLSKYNISEHGVELLDQKWDAIGKVDLKTLESYMSNLAKYDQLTKPWGIWFKEALGFATEESEMDSLPEVIQEELHTAVQETESLKYGYQDL
ncbi:MAG: hypothetical protein ACK5WS_04545 [Alphaproteobacteria bacterium]